MVRAFVQFGKKGLWLLGLLAMFLPVGAEELPSLAESSVSLEAPSADPPSTRLTPALQYSYKMAKSVHELVDVDALSSLKPPKVVLEETLAQSDLEFLWQQTIVNNPMLRFSVEKVALPVEAHNEHSSRFLRNTLSLAVSGGAMASSLFLGSAPYQTMGILTGSQAVQNVLKGKTPIESSLTPTEHIQLAELVDSLKQDLKTSYWHYQQALSRWQQASIQADTQLQRYEKQTKAGASLAGLLALDAYHTALAEELAAQQEAFYHRLKLERLAGDVAVEQLSLALKPEAVATVVAQAASKPLPVLPKSSTPTLAPLPPLTLAVDTISNNTKPLAERRLSKEVRAKKKASPPSLLKTPSTPETTAATLPTLPLQEDVPVR